MKHATTKSPAEMIEWERQSRVDLDRNPGFIRRAAQWLRPPEPPVTKAAVDAMDSTIGPL